MEQIQNQLKKFKDLVPGRKYNFTINGQRFEYKARVVSKDTKSAILITPQRQGVKLGMMEFRISTLTPECE